MVSQTPSPSARLLHGCIETLGTTADAYLFMCIKSSTPKHTHTLRNIYPNTHTHTASEMPETHIRNKSMHSAVLSIVPSLSSPSLRLRAATTTTTTSSLRFERQANELAMQMYVLFRFLCVTACATVIYFVIIGCHDQPEYWNKIILLKISLIFLWIWYFLSRIYFQL